MDVVGTVPTSLEGEETVGGGGGGRDDDRDEDATANAPADSWETNRSVILKELHERNATKVFNSMLDLGGLYIKLGQVLSVTALPVPEEYRVLFRKLQSDVPNTFDFETVIRPTLVRELGISSLDEVFESIDAIPCGAASIGQAHRAVLLRRGGGLGKEEVIVKVQYPNAMWEVPADIECVGDLLKLCVFFGVLDETSSKLSYDEFSRQFLMELDYVNEWANLKSVHASSLDPMAPYIRRGVIVPRPHDDLCTDRVVTMTYLPGPKFETEARRQLASLGVDVGKRGMRDVVMMDAGHGGRVPEDDEYVGRGGSTVTSLPEGGGRALSSSSLSHTRRRGRVFVSRLVSVDAVLSIVRLARRIASWSTSIAARCVKAAPSLLVGGDWKVWADAREVDVLRSEHWGWTREAVSALFDVHGYQILNQGLFSECVWISFFALSDSDGHSDYLSCDSFRSSPTLEMY
jgi:aarF domain-containing kinase